MFSHPDADAFMRTYLRTPTDVTTRLVFADWLEETGTPSNVAWANYIRAKAAADQHRFGSLKRVECEDAADWHSRMVIARLTIPAHLFVGYPRSLLQLLPPQHITVRLGECDIASSVYESMPESVARENLVMPLDLQDRILLVTAADPGNRDTVEKLRFILNRDIVAVRGEPDDIQATIDRHYGLTEYEHFDSCRLVTFES